MRGHSPARYFLLGHMILSYINVGPQEMKCLHKYNDMGVTLCSAECNTWCGRKVMILIFF